jgi:hypothetical protein
MERRGENSTSAVSTWIVFRSCCGRVARPSASSGMGRPSKVRDTERGFCPWRFAQTTFAALGAAPSPALSTAMSAFTGEWGRFTHSRASPTTRPSAS